MNWDEIPDVIDRVRECKYFAEPDQCKELGLDDAKCCVYEVCFGTNPCGNGCPLCGFLTQAIDETITEISTEEIDWEV